MLIIGGQNCNIQPLVSSTYRWPSGAQVERGINPCTGRPSIGVMIQETVYIVLFWPPDDEHVCSKHVEA